MTALATEMAPLTRVKQPTEPTSCVTLQKGHPQPRANGREGGVSVVLHHWVTVTEWSGYPSMIMASSVVLPSSSGLQGYRGHTLDQDQTHSNSFTKKQNQEHHVPQAPTLFTNQPLSHSVPTPHAHISYWLPHTLFPQHPTSHLRPTSLHIPHCRHTGEPRTWCTPTQRHPDKSRLSVEHRRLQGETQEHARTITERRHGTRLKS